MVSFFDFMMPTNSGVDADTMDRARRQGALNAASVLANMSAKNYQGYSPSAMQLVTGGLQGFQQGANAGLEQFYNTEVNKSKAADAGLKTAYAEKARPIMDSISSGVKPPVSLREFYTPLQPTALTAAQIKQESGGNPNAVSSKGAYGLMQLMPETQKDPGFGVAPLRNGSPEENVRLGQDYQQAMMKRYGDLPTALMAYNWGPDNVDKWIAGGRNPNAVPAETRDYVQKITSNLQGDTGLPSNVQQPSSRPGSAYLADQLQTLGLLQTAAVIPNGANVLEMGLSMDPANEFLRNKNMPAVMQIANAMTNAQKNKDTQYLENLATAGKFYDRGLTPDGQGGVRGISGYTQGKRDISYNETAGAEQAKSDIKRLTDQSTIVARLPLLEKDLSMYQQKMEAMDPALMGPIRGTVAYYTSPEVQSLTSNARSVALQLKDIYNLGSGQGFTDTDRDYLDSIIGGAKVDPAAAMPVLMDMYQRLQTQKDVFTETSDYYKKNNNLSGFIPGQGDSPSYDRTTSNGVKYRIVQ